MLASAFVSRRRRGGDTSEVGAAPAVEREQRRRACQRQRAEAEERQQGHHQRLVARDGALRAAPAPAASATEQVPGPGASTAAERKTAGGERGTGSASVAAAAVDQMTPPESARSSAELCAVCLEDVRGAAAPALPCSHAYHPGCLLPWLAVHRACPCCRATVPAPEESEDTA